MKKVCIILVFLLIFCKYGPTPEGLGAASVWALILASHYGFKALSKRSEKEEEEEGND